MTQIMMKEKILFVLLSLVLLATGCASTTPGQKGALMGSAAGAGLGAIIGHQAGRRTAEGAIIGAAAGGLGGALLGEAAASKFCPTCGRTYFADQMNCPMDGTLLQTKGNRAAPAQVIQPAPTTFVPAPRSVVINVPNKNGSYTPVTLQVMSDGTYVGPRGEVYPNEPTQDQLQQMYGK